MCLVAKLNQMHSLERFSIVSDTSHQISAASCTIDKKCVHAGRMGVVRVDMQGVQALQSNPQVQAIYVYLGPISVEEWAQQQASRSCHCVLASF